jgi:predicted lipoprotein with Yx(FWY)xxD motif
MIGSGGEQAAAGTSPYYEVKTGTVPGLGTVLVDGQGLTLYMFVPDDQRGKSTCYDSCASAWPPLRLPTGVTIPVAAGQAEASLLGTTTRKDGGLQVTYNGWPLYLWVGDSGPDQATGQGIDSLGGYWYVLAPQGKVIKTSR